MIKITFQLIVFPLLQASKKFILLLSFTLPVKYTEYIYVFRKGDGKRLRQSLPISADLCSSLNSNFSVDSQLWRVECKFILYR